MADDPVTNSGDADASDPKPDRRKFLLLGGGLALVVLVSVVSTALLMFALKPDPPAAAAGLEVELSEAASSADFQRLEALVQAQADSIRQMRSEIRTLSEVERPSDLKAAMTDQEQRYQAFLMTIKEGMIDLANMVRGSRTWLEQYGTRLDQAIEDSKAREQALLSTAENDVVEE